jgi:hypothetical protein
MSLGPPTCIPPDSRPPVCRPLFGDSPFPRRPQTSAARGWRGSRSSARRRSGAGGRVSVERARRGAPRPESARPHGAGREPMPGDGGLGRVGVPRPVTPRRPRSGVRLGDWAQAGAPAERKPDVKPRITDRGRSAVQRRNRRQASCPPSWGPRSTRPCSSAKRSARRRGRTGPPTRSPALPDRCSSSTSTSSGSAAGSASARRTIRTASRRRSSRSSPIRAAGDADDRHRPAAAVHPAMEESGSGRSSGPSSGSLILGLGALGEFGRGARRRRDLRARTGGRARRRCSYRDQRGVAAGARMSGHG